MAVVVFTALFTNYTSTRALCYQALKFFAVWPLFTAGIICLATGVVLGLGSKYGLVRYWWVATKLALNLALTGLVPLALSPGLSGLSELAHELAVGHPVTASIGSMIYPPIVSPAARASKHHQAEVGVPLTPRCVSGTRHPGRCERWIRSLDPDRP